MCLNLRLLFVFFFGFIMVGQSAVLKEASGGSPEGKSLWTYDGKCNRIVSIAIVIIKWITGYDDIDPSSWPSDPDKCGGEHQSPVNIDPALAVQDPDILPLIFVNYGTLFPQVITNDGHTSA